MSNYVEDERDREGEQKKGGREGGRERERQRDRQRERSDDDDEPQRDTEAPAAPFALLILLPNTCTSVCDMRPAYWCVVRRARSLNPKPYILDPKPSFWCCAVRALSVNRRCNGLGVRV